MQRKIPELIEELDNLRAEVDKLLDQEAHSGSKAEEIYGITVLCLQDTIDTLRGLA